MRTLNFNVGRRQFRSSYKGSDQQALREDLDASLAQILSNMREVIAAIDGATPEILVEVLEPTFEKTQVLVPFKTGALKESGYLEVRKLYGGAEAEMGYGMHGNPDYAIYVHEMPYNHAEPTSDKFLERPVLEDWNSFPQRLADAVREAVGT